jgi:hypothetical protein
MCYTFEEGENILREILVSNNRPVLFLGAGFSVEAKNKANSIDGKNLKDYIYNNMVKDRIADSDKTEVESYNLRRLCDEVYNLDEGKDKLYNFFRESFNNTKPAQFHNNLIKYPWKQIYTVNIDDLVENIYKNNGKDLVVQNKQKLKIYDRDEVPHLFKLHGCVNNIEDGFVFSEEEYSELIGRTLDAKINELVSDMQKQNIILVGASFDEPDIRFYLEKYERAGCKYRNNKLIIIDYKPSRYLKNFSKKIDAILIEASAEKFLNYIGKLNFQPSELDKAITRLNYNGVHLLNTIATTFSNPYESKLYQGYFCQWQDIFDGWNFENIYYREACDKLDHLISIDNQIVCFSIYGNFFTGKTCLLKSLAYYLKNKDYEILEYKGISFNIKVILDYIKLSTSTRFCLIIDNASHYYEQIEKMFNKKIDGKKIVILTGSRTYYHLKKKYYLDGNSFDEYKLNDELNRANATIVRDKLDEKNYLSYMSSYTKNLQIKEIMKQKTIVNLIVKLTYGSVSKYINTNISRTFEKFSSIEKKLLLELAIFDIVDIELYPRQLFSERYGKEINLNQDISKNNMRIVDFVRMDNEELSLKNSIVAKFMINKYRPKLDKYIIEILKFISKYVYENINNIWYIIFQGLLKEDVLINKLNIPVESIENIYFSVKSDFKNISYFWLQLGLYKQIKGEYIDAYTYLENSLSIRPKSYKIQHAIARNYLRHANNIDNFEEASILFKTGEEKIKELINSKEYYKEKAKPFSVNSYILEKVRFCKKFNKCPSDKELKYMDNIINSVKLVDDYMEKVYHAFFVLLNEYKKIYILKLNSNSPYLKYIGGDNVLNLDDLEYENIVEDL